MFASIERTSSLRTIITSPRIVFSRPVELRRWDSIEPALVQLLLRLETCIHQCLEATTCNVRLDNTYTSLNSQEEGTHPTRKHFVAKSIHNKSKQHRKSIYNYS